MLLALFVFGNVIWHCCDQSQVVVAFGNLEWFWKTQAGSFYFFILRVFLKKIKFRFLYYGHPQSSVDLFCFKHFLPFHPPCVSTECHRSTWPTEFTKLLFQTCIALARWIGLSKQVARICLSVLYAFYGDSVSRLCLPTWMCYLQMSEASRVCLDNRQSSESFWCVL